MSPDAPKTAMVASNAVVVLVTATLGFGVMKAVAVVVVLMPRMAAADRRATSFMVMVRGGEVELE